ncbi:2-hydroxyacid dehydrogenase [Acetanaerobacterium elongatum]|uniref:D-lactate dehydrogenase n=1 Tax=Acetanaerobacterium elongatum TaxID=258515 RepID=A0A1H0FJM6_9FIRM|nr:2-hydroxyacid dehydrogenase [Acetanaerobacterium elongatum]SDN94857.1 D-lactate dehydrogenase [Acetanaerobacterium elongatum]
MKKLAFFDAKPYDKIWFDQLKESYNFKIKYFENKLNEDTAAMAAGSDGVVAFVNDTVDAPVIETLYKQGIRILALRSAGYNNVDFKAAYNKIHVVRVPAYSPYAVAEHAMALLLTLNRKIHRAYNRTRDYNFSLNGLTGFDLHGKTIGVVGTGKIGQVFIDICRGFGLQVLAYDPFPVEGKQIEYVSLSELCSKADIISLHCPLTKDTHHMINSQTLSQMRDGVVIVNTSRGALIDSEALLEAIKSKKVGAAGLDVYEEESELFFEDFSNTIIQDDILARLVSMPNVIVTSHQAFLTNEALHNIAETTLKNLKSYFDGEELKNEICYQCDKAPTCEKKHANRCF